MDELTFVRILNPVLVLFTGLLTMSLPHFTRRGLLFGVYVGPEHAHTPEARAITRRWYVVTGAVTAAGLLAVVVLDQLRYVLPALGVAVVVPLVGILAAYAQAHAAARSLATAGTPPAVAPLEASEPSGRAVEVIALVLCVALGLYALAEAATHYSAMPDRVPTHFGLRGQPDAWGRRSFATVMTIPLIAALLGPFLAFMALLLGNAKRAVRAEAGGISLAAQVRFRAAVARFLAVVAVMVTAMQAGLSHLSIQVALGRASTLGDGVLVLVLAGVLTVVTVAGVIRLMLVHGQGGARREVAVADRPLTNGLADNSLWKWGVFYVNQEDPSIFVEKRFGFGYTVNFGNPRAVWLMMGLLGIVVLSLVLAFAAAASR